MHREPDLERLLHLALDPDGGVGRELRLVRVEPARGFDEPEYADLEQVVVAVRRVEVPPDDDADEPEVALDEGVDGLVVASLGADREGALDGVRSADGIPTLHGAHSTTLSVAHAMARLMQERRGTRLAICGVFAIT